MKVTTTFDTQDERPPQIYSFEEARREPGLYHVWDSFGSTHFSSMLWVVALDVPPLYIPDVGKIRTSNCGGTDAQFVKSDRKLTITVEN